MGGRHSAEAAPAPDNEIRVERELAEALTEQAQRSAAAAETPETAETAAAADAATADTAAADLLAAKAGWEAERRDLLEARARELREIEASQLDEVKAQVAALEEAYDFVRPPPVPHCVDEEAAVVACYRRELDDGAQGDVLKCAALVDAYSACARRVATELAAAVAASAPSSSSSSSKSSHGQ